MDMTDTASPASIEASLPEFRRPQRARLILDFEENGEHTHAAAEGWAKINGPWVLWYGDDSECWQSWPMHTVVCVEWESDLPLSPTGERPR